MKSILDAEIINSKDFNQYHWNDVVLKLLNSNVEDPYIIWNNTTRTELLDFVEKNLKSNDDVRHLTLFLYSLFNVLDWHVLQRFQTWNIRIGNSYWRYLYSGLQFEARFQADCKPFTLHTK